MKMNSNFENNVRKVYARATDADLAVGRNWYANAHEIAKEIAFGNARIGAGVLAAISPMMGWKQNIATAKKMIQTLQFKGCLGNSCRKAERICLGEDPWTVLQGNKVLAFFSNIVYPNQYGEVTIDRHAIAIALGRNATNAEAQKLSNIKYYNEVADAYRNIAREVGLKPHELQAVCWVTWRREKGLTD
jgi:hypothetical protein